MAEHRTARSDHRFSPYRLIALLLALTVAAFGLPSGEGGRDRTSDARPFSAVSFDTCGSGPLGGSPPVGIAGGGAATTTADFQETVSPADTAPHTTRYGGAAVVVQPSDVKAPVAIGITALIGTAVPKLDSGMTNVTGHPRAGFRFTPHPMRFLSAVEVTLPYDPALLTDDFTAQDVYTYFYDDVALCWQVLPRVSVDEIGHSVTSRTDHFTDMINATVVAPEHPENVSFNPNQIKGIQAADPASKVAVIAPPQAANTGANQLSYPIEVPPGRLGVAPDLSVRYDSTAGNGWMGMGWNLTTPTITVDTRWGVPRYAGATETETYLLNGEQLTPVSHRGPAVGRTPEKIFHTRVEGAFARIVRHGDSPKNYTWEVTDKNGTRAFYGGTGGEAVLADNDGDVFEWALREVRDRRGNFLRYHYATVADTGVAPGAGGDSEPGRDLYPTRVTYTGSGTTEGPYSVEFVRDRDLNEAARIDKIIDARGRFKRVTADRLRRVEVRFNGGVIRTYDFAYTVGAFKKTLLSSIIQLDDHGAVFTHHGFSYFDDIRDDQGHYNAFRAKPWTVPGDGLGQTVLNRTDANAGDASALDSSTSDSVGGHVYIGAAPPESASKTNSAGMKVGGGRSSSEAIVALLDVDGDGLADKVFRTDNGIRYRKNLSGPSGALSFAGQSQPLPVSGIRAESSNSLTLGVEAYPGAVAAQLDYVNSFSSTSRYFTDVNDDGIQDLVDGGAVLFGRLGANGVPVYGVSADTPVPITGGRLDTSGLFGDLTADRERLIDSFPLLDSVRRWVAPFDGTVRIQGPVRLAPETAAARAAGQKDDGVRVAIQHEDAELWSQDIEPDDATEHAPQGTDSVAVHCGDRLYFRVQSRNDGSLDQVAWDPQITYLAVPSVADVNGLAAYAYNAARDFTLGGRTSEVTAPLTGTMHLSGDVHKNGSTTDDVTVVVTRDGTPVFQQRIDGTATSVVPVDLDVTVKKGQKLRWRLQIDSPVDLDRLRWTPKAVYTAADGVDHVIDAQGHSLVEVFPPYNVDMYPIDGLTAPQGSFSVAADGDLTVAPTLAFDFHGTHPSGRVVFTIKRRSGLVAKGAFEIHDGVVAPAGSFVVHEVLPPVPAGTDPVPAGTDPVPDELFFDFSTLDPDLRGFLTGQSVTVTREGGESQSAPSAFHSVAPEGAFPQPYRGWGAIGYNGNRDRAAQPIVQGDLVVDKSYADRLPDGVDPQAQKDGFGHDPRVDPPKAVPFAAYPKDDRWGSGDQSWVNRTGASSARLGGGSIGLPSASDLDGSVAVPRMSRTQQISLTGGVGGEVGSLGGSVAEGDTDGQLDYLDLNGDGFPDVVGNGHIQYTDPTGGLGSTHGTLPDGAVRRSVSKAGNASAGSAARTIATGHGDAAARENATTNTSEAGNDMPPLGVGLELGGDSSKVSFDLIDINGDSLPDRVYADGQVALNLGYGFGKTESWRNPAAINDGGGLNTGLNLGFNTDFYGFAGGVSYQEGRTSSAATLTDVTGDGLPDRVFAGTPIRVGINTGNGFEDPVEFRGGLPSLDGATVAGDRNVRLGAGAYITIPICFIVACIIINPGVYGTTGASRTERTLRDINGDGFADDLSSTRDNQLVVAENTTGRTNLLRSVARPLGGRMDFDYTRDGNTFDLPQSRFVLSRVTVDDGHPGDGPQVQDIRYAYSGGVYNRIEREFAGYATVVTRQVDADSDASSLPVYTRHYRTDGHYTRGLATSESTQDGNGKNFLEADYTYELTDVDHPSAAADPASLTATIFPHLVRTDRKFFEGRTTPGKTTFTTTAYDSVGNIVESFDAGDPGTADDVDAKVVFTAGDPACQATNILGAAKQIDVFGGGQLMRHREATVDCSTSNITRATVKLNGTENAVTDVAYFPDGNIQSVTGPANKDGQRFKLTYTYDEATATNVTSTVDSFGYRSTMTYNPKFAGAVETTTDENNQVVRNTYDSVGRVAKVTGPYEAPDGATIAFEYHPEAAVPYAITRHVDRQAGGVRPDTIDTVKFVDGLGRTIQTKVDAAVSTGPDTPPADVMTVSGHVVFDAQGRTVRTSFPVTEPKGAANSQFNAAVDPVQPTVTTHDVLGRVTRTVLPDNTATSVAYGFGSDRSGTTQFETATTDANGKVKRAYVDLQQRITAIKEANPAGGQTVIWTSYRYDPLGSLTAAVDDHSNTTTSAYDLSARRTTLISPDSGRTDTVYDPAGNVIKKITAKLDPGQAIQYDYDYNRLKAIRYPVFQANNVAYTYGAPGAPNNAANRITVVTDGAGTLTRQYGPLGEVVSEARTVAAQGNKTVTFTTQYQYDTWNRMLGMTYPDGEVLTYHYDSGGQVDSAAGAKDGFAYTYLQRLYYDKFGQRVLVDTGNGTRTQYTYDSQNRRLANMKANIAQGYVFQNLNYSYDAVGNVTSIQNDTLPPSGPQVGTQVGGPSSQTFQYDDLYQLVHAEGSYQPRGAKTDVYTIDLQYDSIHNLTHKAQTHQLVSNGNAQTEGKLTYTFDYAYAGTRPHAPTTVGPYTFAYDANGNQVSRAQQPQPRRQMIWDEENRLACSHENVQSRSLPQTPASCDNAGGTPNDARYLYDDQGNRIVKDSAQFHFYPNQNYSTDGNKAFKHVYIGGTKLVTKLVEPSRLEDQQFYAHTDQLGSVGFVTGADGGLAEHLQYLPGGETWVSEHPSQPVPQQFGGKELDPETNLYYFGARYYDPKTQLWQSPDPILSSYLDGKPNGGVFVSANLALYTYADNNPVTYTDPNGQWTWRGVFDAAVRGVTYAVGGAIVVGVLVAAFPVYGAAIGSAAVATGMVALTNSASIVVTGQDYLGNTYTGDERVYAGVETVAGLAAGMGMQKVTARALTPREEAPPPQQPSLTPDQKGTLGKSWSRASAIARGWRVVGEEIDLVFNINGQDVGVRPDLIAIDRAANGGHGQLIYIEAKYSPKAPMTPGQKIVIPELQQAGSRGLTATVKFNRGGFVKGQRLNVILHLDVWTGEPTLAPGSTQAKPAQ